jgi:hypothetical protein
MVRVARGLNKSHTNAKDMSVEEVLLALKTRTDCFEVLHNDDVPNRIYLDIDGKNLPDMTEDEFNQKDKETYDALIDYFEDKDDYCLMTASSYLHKIVSWRIHMKHMMATKKDNELFAKYLKDRITLPDGVSVDTGIYNTNRKMRMLGSNKDGENRPLRLVKGEPIDTIITFTDGCTLKEIEKPEVKRGRPAKVKDSKLLPIFDLLPVELIDDYEPWIKMGMVCKNAGEPLEVFKQVSSRSTKYNERECEKKWETFTKGGLTIWKFLKDHAPDVYERVKQNDYEYTKQDFETTHFKVINPPMIVRITESAGLQYMTQKDFNFIYRNRTCNGESFANKWLNDPEIRTYENLVFLPKQTAPANSFNLFMGFPVEAVEGDVSVVNDLLRMITGNDEKVYDYVEKWVASIIQKPYEKTGVVLVNQGSQGVGKDTYFNFIGSMLGTEYFMNTGNAENDVWGRFTDDQQRILFMKFEEANFVTNKAHADKLKNLVTSTVRKFEGKGLKAITLNNFINLVMTTNHDVPVLLEDSDRRFCCFKASDEKRGDFEYWKTVYSALENPATKSAYYHHLMNIDLTGFNPRDFPKTEYYETIRVALAPTHSQYFQKIVEDCMEHGVEETEYKSRHILAKLQEEYKYDYKAQTLGRDISKYPRSAISKRESNSVTYYTIHAKGMKEFLESKNWWVVF